LIKNNLTKYDILVIGGGHAGIEAAVAASGLGARVGLVTHDRLEIGRMPCNPAIGGLGKGHLVRELDVLGGLMGRAIDATGIQFRVLNRRKGPAVQAPRAQADKAAYQAWMVETVSARDGLEIIEGDVVDLVGGLDGEPLTGVQLADGRCLEAARTVLCTGTFLGGLMHTGDERRAGGREGAAASTGISAALSRRDVSLLRLKTGTPPRIHRDSVDWSCLEAQPGDAEPVPFSFATRGFAPNQVDCHIAWTNERTHALIRENLSRSPLYAGAIDGRGPRYCPSIEDKIVRFADKARHHVFLEPEGLATVEVYVNGVSTSLPRDVQEGVLRSIEGLGSVEVLRYGYAVEYDSVLSHNVSNSLRCNKIEGLYLAGQILGTSGYEEAAAQGFLAGVNAVRSLTGAPAFVPGRGEAYLGVLVDDLVTKEISEPYRMFTSRAERRLALRCDNAATRLRAASEELGLLPESDRRRLAARTEAAARARHLLDEISWVEEPGAPRLSARERLLRPEVEEGALMAHPALVHRFAETFGEDWLVRDDGLVRESVQEAVNTVRYAGYIEKQDRLLGHQAHLDELEIPVDFPYASQRALSSEAREKLALRRPANLGQAGRIDGVRQSDLAVLSVLIRRREPRDG
jgi:tRNA uridine 5-carboxymethylaminomethyl modification enzyme